MISFFAPLPPEAAAGLSALTFVSGWIFGRGSTKPLRAFWVGVDDVYAARSEEEALKVAIEDGAAGLTLDDILEITGSSLWHPIPGEGVTQQTLAELLSKSRRPGWVAGALR